MTAVKERYGAIDDENAGVIVEDMYVCGNNQRTTVEVVGAKSVNLHQRLVIFPVVTQCFEDIVINAFRCR